MFLKLLKWIAILGVVLFVLLICAIGVLVYLFRPSCRSEKLPLSGHIGATIKVVDVGFYEQRSSFNQSEEYTGCKNFPEYYPHRKGEITYWAGEPSSGLKKAPVVPVESEFIIKNIYLFETSSFEGGFQRIELEIVDQAGDTWTLEYGSPYAWQICGLAESQPEFYPFMHHIQEGIDQGPYTFELVEQVPLRNYICTPEQIEFNEKNSPL